jgi:LPXTG-motif cell wall-anchored protein
MFIVLPLLAIASIIGGSIGELVNLVLPLNLNLTEGGGSPTLLTQLFALGFYILLGALIGWVYGKRKKN